MIQCPTCGCFWEICPCCNVSYCPDCRITEEEAEEQEREQDEWEPDKIDQGDFV
jgi:hypothetical protein